MKPRRSFRRSLRSLSLAAFAVAGFGLSLVNAVARPSAQDDIGEFSDRAQAIFWAKFGRVRAVMSVFLIGVGTLVIGSLDSDVQLGVFALVFVACGATGIAMAARSKTLRTS